jgi:hypothetical protein
MRLNGGRSNDLVMSDFGDWAPALKAMSEATTTKSNDFLFMFRQFK